MRIIHIEDFFHPNAGYQVNILAKFMARNGHDVTVITSEMDKIPEYLTGFFGRNEINQQDLKYEDTYGVKIIRLPLKAYISGRAIYIFEQLWMTIDAIKPDVIYVHGNDTYVAMRVFLRAKKLGCAIVTDSHMVELASANRFRKLFRLIYRWIITPKIISNHIPVIRTADVDYVMKNFKIPKKMAPVVSLGTDTMLFYPDQGTRKSFREVNNISDNSFVILYAGKLDESKGGMLLAQLTQKKIRTDREVVFCIVGNATGEYGEKVEEEFKKSNYIVLRFPTQAYSDLSKFYQGADVAIIPKACSLSIFDFAASGLGLVVEDNETNVIRVQSLKGGKIFRRGDVDDFAEKIAEYANMDIAAFEKEKISVANIAKELYGYEKQYKKYMKVIEKAISRQKKEK